MLMSEARTNQHVLDEERGVIPTVALKHQYESVDPFFISQEFELFRHNQLLSTVKPNK